jgi:hypothetical protein
MRVPMGSNFLYEEDGIIFRVFYKSRTVKVSARHGNRTVIEYGYTPHEGAEKAFLQFPT